MLHHASLVFLGLLASGWMVLAGCSSSDPGQAAVTRRAETMDVVTDMRDDLSAADAQIASTEQSLGRLTSQRAVNLERSYDQFRDEVARNEVMSNRINARASKLTNDSYRQINEWNYQSRTIRNDQLRQKSLNNEAVAKKQHDEMVANLNELRGAYTNYIRALQDIETYAANNLTPQGLAELGAERSKAAGLAQLLRQKMAVLDSHLDEMATDWRPDVALAERNVGQNAQPSGQQIPGHGSDEVPANTPATAGR